jgi:hypothetical protein
MTSHARVKSVSTALSASPSLPFLSDHFWLLYAKRYDVLCTVARQRLSLRGATLVSATVQPIFIRQYSHRSDYKPSRYKSEALSLWPQRCNTAKPTRCFRTVSHKYSLLVARHAIVVVAVPSTVHYPTNYKLKIYYLR